MSTNNKKLKPLKWFNPLKNINKRIKDEDQIKDSTKMSQFSNLCCKVVKSFKRFTFDNEKNIHSDVTTLQKDGRTTNKQAYTIGNVNKEERKDKSDIDSNASTSKSYYIDWENMSNDSSDEEVSSKLSDTFNINEAQIEDQSTLQSQNSKTYFQTEIFSSQLVENTIKSEGKLRDGRELNYSDINEAFSKLSIYKDHDYSASDSYDEESTSDEEVISRGPPEAQKPQTVGKKKTRAKRIKKLKKPNGCLYEQLLEYSKVSKEIDNTIDMMKIRDSNNNFYSPGFQVNNLQTENEVEEFLNSLPNINFNSRLNLADLQKSLECNTLRGLAPQNQPISNHGNQARNELFLAQEFCECKCDAECKKIYKQIEDNLIACPEKTIIIYRNKVATPKVIEAKEIIHYLDENEGKNSYRRTNLHVAVQEENWEQCFAIIEIQKRIYGSINTTLINSRDSKRKYVLDYALKKENSELLIKYLRENKILESISIPARKKPVKKSQ